jgi:hypothetical protein
MTDVLEEVLVMALALAVVAFGVGAGRDRALFVPPPEAVVEGFARQLATGRYDRALQYVNPAAGISVDSLREASDDLRLRHGPVNHVSGEAGTAQGDMASAAAVFRTQQSGEIRHEFVLAWRRGLWKILEWDRP